MARPMPNLTGNSCTATLNSACCASPRAGGPPRPARKSRLQAHSPRRRRPIVRWCEGPAPRLRRSPGQSSPGLGARERTTFHAPGAWAPEATSCANPVHPSATVRGTALSPSHFRSLLELQGEGHLEEALNEYDEAIRLDLQTAPGYNNRDSAYNGWGSSSGP